MSYSGHWIAAQSRESLGSILQTLQEDAEIPLDVLAVAKNLAHAVGALFEAEHASSEVDGKASVKHAMGTLSQTMALLQDVRSQHAGIDAATRTIAQVMSKLYPLSQAPTHRTSSAPVSVGVGSPQPAATKVSQKARERISAEPVARERPGELFGREKLEANIGATTESNFFVGFSGDIGDGGVFVATYQTMPIDTRVELLVTLPGGFQKTIAGTVRFVRDPMDMESEPGIGVGFDHLDEQGRALVLRFIRKRPPLFYDE
jgi:uncharacterized protein (TIGR02266 family)